MISLPLITRPLDKTSGYAGRGGLASLANDFLAASSSVSSSVIHFLMRCIYTTKYSMRAFIDLIEAAFPGGNTFWFNPADKEVISCSDHGTAVADNPYAFGIDYRIQDQMAEAFAEPERDDDDDDDGFGTADESDNSRELPDGAVAGLWGGGGTWNENDAWEQLAMNNGWVRVGIGRNGSYATYLSSSTGLAVWHAARYLADQDSLTDRMEIEVSRQVNSVFTYLDADTIERFLRTRAPDAFLVRLDR